MTDSQLHDLIDKRALDELVNRQAIAVDTHQWDVYRSCMQDNVHFDFTAHTDVVLGFGIGIVTSADEWVTAVSRAVTGFDATQHFVANTVHTVRADEATSVCFVLAEHILNNDQGDRSITVGGIYTIGSVRTPKGWKIKTWHLKPLWYRGNITLYQLAAKKQGSGQ